MAITKTIQATVKNRTDTAANWTQKNPVLAEGEIIVVQTSAGETRLKIGDGVKTFTQLPYTDEQIYNNVVTSVNGQTGDITLDIPGGGADWAQNNPDGDGYIKNRPGGYMTDPVITDVDTFTITSAEVEGGVYFAVVAVESSAITLSDYTIGDGVIVDFGGQSYSLTWQSSEGYPTCGASVTDKGFDWSSAPFCIMAVFGQEGGLRGYYVYLQNAVTSPIQVKLTMAKQTPVKIPEKYLDLDSAKEIVLFTISYNQSSESYESDRTYDELKAALDAGKTVFAKFRNVMGEFYTYGLLYQRAMYVPGIWVYVGGSDPCEWQCAEGNRWTKRQLLRLSTGIGEPKKAGTAAYGTSEYASRDDHVHPSELPDVSADDDGKLLGVTGGVWGKVDMPSGGIDMDITGATVGQIAKIAAVDASGVPTAWSPADMPSGGSSDLYVDFWPTGPEQYNGNFNGYQVELATDQTFDAIFDSIKAGNKIVARLYKDADKSDLSASSVDTAVTGTKEFGAIHFQFVTANADTGAIAGFPFIGEAIMMIKMEEASVSYLIENRNVLPTPNADGTDNGKVPIINGTQWELKTPPAGSPDAVLYTPQTLTDAQKKQARDNIEAADADFVITATVTNNDNCTTDKTYTQIQEAVQAGKKVVVKISAYGFDFVLPLIGKFESDYMFTAVINLANTAVMQFAVFIGEQSNGIAKCRIPIYNSDGNKLEQVEMAAAPTEDMQIATKKYVDDKISNKELILSSSTAGSTKKFKLTIDDTGTLTASEIMA